MNADTQFDRLHQATQDGYLYGDLDRHDEETNAWSQVASHYGFPFVMLTPKDGGLVVTALTPPNSKTKRRLSRRLERMATKAVFGQEGAEVVRLDRNDGVMVGPLEEERARSLAGRMARLTGCAFPISFEMKGGGEPWPRSQS